VSSAGTVSSSYSGEVAKGITGTGCLQVDQAVRLTHGDEGLGCVCCCGSLFRLVLRTVFHPRGTRGWVVFVVVVLSFGSFCVLYFIHGGRGVFSRCFVFFVAFFPRLSLFRRLLSKQRPLLALSGCLPRGCPHQRRVKIPRSSASLPPGINCDHI
jgi:hypothetical protein